MLTLTPERELTVIAIAESIFGKTQEQRFSVAIESSLSAPDFLILRFFFHVVEEPHATVEIDNPNPFSESQEFNVSVIEHGKDIYIDAWWRNEILTYA